MEPTQPLTFGSLFSGAGGFDIGLERAGLECKWQCEIDPQASSVLARHWPDVQLFGDICKLRKKDLSPVDVIAGGFPCQDLSVAGNRKGLSGERSGLFYELLRVARLCSPRVVVWENVPGLLSSDDGQDFARVLRGMADIVYFGAWRVLDARFFGVPQRRRRVFGVFARGHLGAVRCGQILALTEGVRRDSPTGEKAGQDVAFTLTSSVGRNSGGTRVGNAWNTNYVAARCLTSRGQRYDGEADNFVCVTGNTSHSLTAVGSDASEDGTGRGSPIVAPMYYTHDYNQDRIYGTDGAAPACTAHDSNRTRNHLVSGALRRLTPREWERLMSWPDDWTRYAADGTEFADGPRYRMCGNGVVSNCAEWIGRRLIAAAQQGDV